MLLAQVRTNVEHDSPMSDHRKGMTLLEVVVAMGLVFVALLALAGLATTAIKGAAAGKHMTVATSLAQEKLEEIMRGGYRRDAVEGWASVEAYGSLVEYPLYQRTTRIQSQVLMAGLYIVSVTVSWEKDQHAVTLSTMVAE